jgi:hypothetical protein
VNRIDDLLTRRALLTRATGLAALASLPVGCAVAPPGVPARLGPSARLSAWPFTLGVASGDPLPDGVVLWTRLAPEPLHGGGMPPEPVAVEWQVAADDRMRTIVQRGLATATPELGHAVHVEVAGLEPGRWYWYRFVAAGAESPIGRTRTAPAAGAPLDRLRFAFASCQHYGQGYYASYRHMARQELDLVVFLGDYIYESPARDEIVRLEPHTTPISLVQYRNKYGLYKSDPDLQAAHAQFPWLVTWDDHEVANDYADDQSQDRDDAAWFLRRRTAAYQAYYEQTPGDSSNAQKTALFCEKHAGQKRGKRALSCATLAAHGAKTGHFYASQTDRRDIARREHPALPTRRRQADLLQTARSGTHGRSLRQEHWHSLVGGSTTDSRPGLRERIHQEARWCYAVREEVQSAVRGLSGPHGKTGRARRYLEGCCRQHRPHSGLPARVLRT